MVLSSDDEKEQVLVIIGQGKAGKHERSKDDVEDDKSASGSEGLYNEDGLNP